MTLNLKIKEGVKHYLEMGIACWVGMTILNSFVNPNTIWEEIKYQDGCHTHKDQEEVLLLCPSCQKYKQGLIQGAKMVIEEIRRISEEYFNEEYYHDFPKEPFETLKQLNNWLEKE
jgi:hypothetical protein